MRANALERLNYQDADFKFIQSILIAQAGISLNNSKKELVYSRLAKRIRNLGLNNFADYCNILSSDKREVHNCINSMTTNVTSFFREIHHFEFLREFLGKNQKRTNKIRIWSAGCSTGEEPYSIAFTCFDQMLTNPGLDIEITATDLDTQVISKASNGVYNNRDVSEMSDNQLRRWFLKGKGARQGQVRVIKPIQDMIDYSQLNLKDEWQHEEKFDVIFCRNVMIYFDNTLRTALLEKFHDNLNPDGYLILGHSESLFGLSTKFQVIGRTIHQKLAAKTLQGAELVES